MALLVEAATNNEIVIGSLVESLVIGSFVNKVHKILKVEYVISKLSHFTIHPSLHCNRRFNSWVALIIYKFKILELKAINIFYSGVYL